MNPIIKTVFCADPSAHVWPGSDQIWLYTSHDQPGTNTHDSMKSYHVFSSKDLVHWIDYGCVLHIDDVKWASKQLWAPDAVYRNGVYYMVSCAFEAATGIFRTGLAESSRPEGPFTDIGYIEGVKWGQDPCLFIDDDETPYLYCGAGHVIEGYQLSDDLKSVVEGTYVDLTPQLPWAFEGPWIHKHNGLYYLSYPGLYNNEWPEHMYYATAKHPLGPYTYVGEYIPPFENTAGTNHGSIIKFKEQWLAFHHSMWVSKMGQVRSVMCDYLEHKEDGTILPIIPSSEGVHAIDTTEYQCKVTLLLDASVASFARGKMYGTKKSTEIPGYTGHGYATGFDTIYSGVTVMAQSGYDRVGHLFVRYQAPYNDENMKLMVNDVAIAAIGEKEDIYDKRIPFPKTETWQELYLGQITLKAGDNYIELYKGSGHIHLDYFRIEEF